MRGRRRAALDLGTQRERERVILDALSPAAREAHAVILGELGLPPDAPWYELPILRRLFEQLAWRNLAARAEAHGLTPWPAEEEAARQLGRDVRTLQTRLRGKTPTAPFT